MREHDLAFEPQPRFRQGRCKLAEENVCGIRGAVGIAVELALEHIDFAVGHISPQVIEAAAEPEAELKDNPSAPPDLLESPGEAGMLRLQTIEKLFQPG